VIRDHLSIFHFILIHLILICFIEKSLKLTRSSLGHTTVGQIVNIMSNDVKRFDDVRLIILFDNLMQVFLLIALIVRLIFSRLVCQSHSNSPNYLFNVGLLELCLLIRSSGYVHFCSYTRSDGTFVSECSAKDSTTHRL
jgi:hypothetical protein